MASLEDLERRVSDVERVASKAKEAADRNARDGAVYQKLQSEQANALAAMARAQSDLLVSVTEINTNVAWVREELANKVDDAAVSAKMAKQEAEAAREDAKNAKASKTESGNARAYSIIAMLVAIIAALLGVDAIPFP